MRSIVAFFLAALAVAPVAAQAPARRSAPGTVRVRLETTAGNITVALDARRAPATARNFLAYVDDGRFDGTVFYRAARKKIAPKFGFIQGGIRTDARRILPPFPLETTARTGIKHLDATISMARPAYGGSAGGNFFITVGAAPNMDAGGGREGYPAFGRVIGGMDVVRRILAGPTCCGDGAMRGQMLVRAVEIRRAVRLDGKPQPTGRVKPWLIGVKLKTS
ncbi:peptidyl-prolyl cis-trans isomerase A (cyclophilin A) [Sphingomonas guangdongensis]|uniref:peptidylprolyl isomerase n=1 Tax=Sphingomonas guangdongensis TaxID=1141890 RepID=A0A285R0P9_9SPHN|nr:peptidylprolyl isomerase [Sphingomonas guangdongensis]SOB87358.1 peptidyl-prolyl cis-trans isomerase A (cyclophilin A) [Sphingomonas guangdongensis]